MVIGITRPRDSRSVYSVESVQRNAVADEWQNDRGEIRYEVSCDLFGGFPGFAQRGGAYSGAQLRITDRFILIDEGRAGGFGLPISWLEGAIVFPFQQRDEPGLRVFYKDGVCPRVFTIRFRGGRLSMRAHRRADHSLNLLTTLGMNEQFSVEAPIEPNFRIPWDQTHQFELENVVWTGSTTASLQVGFELSPADVWLTTKSLIWGSSGGDGINRVPLQLLQDVITAQVSDRQKTPAVYVSFGDETTGRYDLAFLFDRYDTERNVRERGAFLVGLRSRGVPLGAPVPLYQPWRLTNQPVVSQPALPQATEEMPTMERPLRRRRRTSLSQMTSRHVDDAEEPTWSDSFAGEEEDGDLELFDVSDAVWPETYSPAPYLRVVNESYEEPVSLSRAPAWEEAPDADDCWERELEEPVDAAADLLPAGDEINAEPAAGPAEASETIEEPPIAESAAQTDSDVVLAVFAGTDEPEGATGESAALGDYELATEWLVGNGQTEPLSPSFPPAVGSLAVSQKELDGAKLKTANQSSNAESKIQEYEASCLAVLSEVLRAIDDRVACRPAKAICEPLPSQSLQSSALGALIELTANGDLTKDEARKRRARLIALGESGVRLRALMELRDFGHITTEDLNLKKNQITAQLATFVRPNA